LECVDDNLFKKLTTLTQVQKRRVIYIGMTREINLAELRKRHEHNIYPSILSYTSIISTEVKLLKVRETLRNKKQVIVTDRINVGTSE
jgi:hypothetical protein